MFEATERIWAFQSDGGRRGWLHTKPPQAIIDIPVEYVRADLLDALTEERDRLALANAELLAGLKNASERLAMIECQTLDQTLTTPVSWMDWAKLVVTIGGEEISALLTKHKATSTEREGE